MYRETEHLSIIPYSGILNLRRTVITNDALQRTGNEFIMTLPRPPYSAKDVKAARAYLDDDKVGLLSFSEGTYQVEVREPKKKSFWPFLQLDDAGNVRDGFCSCPEAEKHQSCPHLAAAYLKIFNGHATPIHVRFRTSFWNQLGQMACRRHGYDPKIMKKTPNRYEAHSVTAKCLLTIEPLKAAARKQLEELLFKRVEPTEETSLKFSNLPADELSLWREGRPSPQLLYELSFWSDLAKWWMQLSEGMESYSIVFEGEGLPKWVEIRFASQVVRNYIAEANWPQLIESLNSVKSPLLVHEFRDERIEAIHYDKESRGFKIEFAPLGPGLQAQREKGVLEKGIEIGDWVLVPHVGFFPARVDPIFRESVIPMEKMASVLHQHAPIIQKYLVDIPFHTGGIKAQYAVCFDAQEHLHIACYVFEPGDLQTPFAAYFGSWVYLEEKGFYLLEQLLFDGVEKVIARDQVGEFVNRHRVWLNGYVGFQTHVSSIESQMTYSVDLKGSLRFESGLEFAAEGGEFIDFGEWIYLKGKGFFAKRMGRSGALIHPEMSIGRSDVSRFVRTHRDELEGIQGFFTTRCPVEKSGLEIFLNEDGKIVVRPRFQLFSPYTLEKVVMYGDYTYVPNEGFCEIPFEKRLPEGHVHEHVVSQSDEPFFIAYELESIKDHILSIQKELQRPSELFVRIKQMRRHARTKGAEWLIDLTYESELGSVDAFTIWKALSLQKRYVFTTAGLILLKHPRFNWLKNLPKKKWLKEGKQLRLTTLEWMRLCVFDDLRGPEGNTSESMDTRKVLQELHTFHTDIPINLEGFKSDLRPYQETGVKWLWFLYCHGLSGLLCDEMGLGKTHQAMGIMAAVKNQPEKEGLKFLVVCPTSVIYHWQELLKRFLPDMKVHVFYGIARKLDPFLEQHGVLLTSYGTLRSEKQALSKIEFSIAIFDETQIAKNIHSQTHKALKKIQAGMRVGLSGTPIENRLLELKALFDVIVPGYMPTEAHFKELFVNPIEKNQDPERKALLARFVRHFILRRKKSEVLLELPEKVEELAYCDLSSHQRELYRETFLKHKQGLMRDLQDGGKPVPFMHVFALLSNLKQICDHPCLVTKKFDEFQKMKSGKWDLFVELLQEARESGQKVVVFSQYLDMLSMIEAYLTENQIGFAGIRGSTRNRKHQLDTFRDDPQCEVFVASLQAVGVGVDLVSASVVIHYDRWWNPARENQATDRVHRIGQNRGVQVFKMITKDTIEEHIHRLIEKKMSLSEGVLGFDDQDQIKGLDRQDLLELLRLIDRDVVGNC